MTKEERIAETALKLKLKLQTMLITASGGKVRNLSKYTWIGVNDFADIIKYCDYILNKEYNKALKLQRDMDTPVYELLPYNLYNFIQEYY